MIDGRGIAQHDAVLAFGQPRGNADIEIALDVLATIGPEKNLDRHFFAREHFAILHPRILDSGHTPLRQQIHCHAHAFQPWCFDSVQIKAIELVAPPARQQHRSRHGHFT